MRRNRGFTLIELMVVLAVIAIIAAIALPSFTKQVMRSHRADAARGLSELQLRQERWRASHAKYIGTDSSAGDLTAFGSLPISDYYTFTLDSAESATGFTVKATPTGTQANDSDCNPMRIAVSGTTVSKTPTTGRCWN
jgi:type IV pilus assembly protein PilE